MGRGVIIVAGGMVTSDVPPLTILGGVPARAIGLVHDLASEAR